MKLILVFGIFLFTVVAVFGQTFSPKHTVTKKYHLITLSPVNWYKAFYHCRSLDMHLVSISSREENNKIIQQIKDEGHESKDFWLSGVRSGFNGVFNWMGSGKPVKFSDWAPGQPDALPEDCMQIFGTTWDDKSALKWNNRPCDVEMYFICEEEMIEYEYCTNS